jgi:hypothetical protein
MSARSEPQPPFPPDEVLYDQGHVQAFQWCGVELPPLRARFFAFGGLGFLVGALFGAALLTRRRQRQLARLAEPQWRLVDNGRYYLTDRRLAFDCTRGWTDVWLHDIATIDFRPDGVYLTVDAMFPTRLDTPDNAHLAALLRRLTGHDPV